jgi:Tfp pilus assembly protein PilN
LDKSFRLPASPGYVYNEIVSVPSIVRGNIYPPQTVPETTVRPHISVNLLNQDDFSQSAVGKVMLWALSIGRYIVVFTELIVILSFLSRFTLDRRLTDLNEEIARQKAIILSYGTLEADFRDLQQRLKIIHQQTPSLTAPQILTLVNRILPPDVRLIDMNINAGQLQFNAIALSSQGFAQFVTAILTQNTFNQVTLGSVSSEDQGNTIEFSLTAQLPGI